MLDDCSSATLPGIDAAWVHVEVNAGQAGEPKLFLVGPPDAAVKKSGDSIFAAMHNRDFRSPRIRLEGIEYRSLGRTPSCYCAQTLP